MGNTSEGRRIRPRGIDSAEVSGRLSHPCPTPPKLSAQRQGGELGAPGRHARRLDKFLSPCRPWAASWCLPLTGHRGPRGGFPCGVRGPGTGASTGDAAGRAGETVSMTPGSLERPQARGEPHPPRAAGAPVPRVGRGARASRGGSRFNKGDLWATPGSCPPGPCSPGTPPQDMRARSISSFRLPSWNFSIMMSQPP